jgi:hypothetical protein
MFGLMRFLFSLVMLAAFIWFAVTVPLGKRTLWGHVQAIFGTQEAKDLAEGTKDEAEKVARKVREDLRTPDMAHTAHKTRPPLDPVDERDRKRLDKAVKDKTR